MPLNDISRIQTRSTTSNRELCETISALFPGTDKLDLSTMLSRQGSDDLGEAGQIRNVDASNQYLQALLGMNSELDSPPGVLKSKAVGGSNRQRSVSFSTPEIREGFSKTFNTDITTISGESPVRMRSHASEAGSPTLEQALLMGRDSPESDAGYGSFQAGTPEFNSTDLRPRDRDEADDSLSPNSRSGDRSLSPGEPRPTLATLVEAADMAVAQAVQNLQDLKERQAAIHQVCNVKENNIISALLSASQAPRNNIQVSGNDDYERRDRFSFNDDFDLREAGDRRDPLALERAARQYRNAASIHEANCTWNGQLPPKQPPGRSPSYSNKIFLGGVPWDITEGALLQAFIEFGPVRVEWPGREASAPPKGYLYIVFEDEERVKDLLANCTHDFSHGGSYYFKISSKKRGTKEIQIIPWLVADSNYVRFPSPRLDPKKTVFVGALHGMLNAQNLAVIFNDLFGGVVYAGLDTDKHKYPIGSGRVTFNNSKSYMKAVAAAFIEIKTQRFCKKVQVDPYLEDALCSLCHVKQGPYFCRDLLCFNYYCRSCWDHQHVNQTHHKPLMRNIRGLTRARLQDILPGAGDCYSAVFNNNRDKSYDSWSPADQFSEKRYGGGLDSWRSVGLEKQQQQYSESWRPKPEITWRNQDQTLDSGWYSQRGEVSWGEDVAKFSSVFGDSLNIGSERRSGLKPFFDRDPMSYRSALDKDARVFEPDTAVASSLHSLLDKDQALFSRPLMEEQSTSLRSFLDRDQGLHPVYEGETEDH